MDILKTLLGGGKSTLAVNPGLLQDQLEGSEIDSDKAGFITSLAYAMDATLAANPAIQSFLPSQQCLALAALYGSMLRRLDDLILAPTTPAERQASAIATRGLMDKIVILAQSADPRATQNAASDQSLDDLLSNLMTDEGAPEPVR